MHVVGSGHIKRLKERHDFLRERISEFDEPSGYDTKEAAALQWALRQLDNDERNITYRRAYSNGQQNVLKFYKKTLRSAVHSCNVSALQFLLDRTNEWLKKAEEDKN